MLPRPPSGAPAADIAAWRASLKAAIAWDRANKPGEYAKGQAKAAEVSPGPIPEGASVEDLKGMLEGAETVEVPEKGPVPQLKTPPKEGDPGAGDAQLEAMKSAARAEASAQAKSDKDLQDEMRSMIGKAAGGTA